MSDFRPCYLMIADVSGYTRFVGMEHISVIHAEQIIADLLESVADATGVPLVLNEVLGDGLYFLAFQASEPETARRILGQAQVLFGAFARRKAELEARRWCTCEACMGLGDLELKVVLHHGPVLLTHMKQFQKASGQPVEVALGLLKNSVPHNRYLMLTEDFHALSGAPDGMDAEMRSEQVQGVGEMPVLVCYPRPAGDVAARASFWQQLTHYLWLNLLTMRRLVLWRPPRVKGLARHALHT